MVLRTEPYINNDSIYRHEIIHRLCVARLSHKVLNNGNDRNRCEQNKSNVDFRSFATIISKIYEKE